MPELPEVEVLVRHLAPLLRNRTIRGVRVNRAKVIAPTTERRLVAALRGAKFTEVLRRGKYLMFALKARGQRESVVLIGHLGMTGRMYLLPVNGALPKHAAVVLDLGKHNFVFEDTRYFGRLTLDAGGVAKLGPEPLGREFTAKSLRASLKHSRQPIKVKLLDQTVVAGVGNIYASEALYRAKISPLLPANKLAPAQAKRLWRSIRDVLTTAIRLGSTLPLDFGGANTRDGLFYYGQAAGASEFFQERLRVYDRQGKPCVRCRAAIIRIVQATRSTFYCPRCQPSQAGGRKIQ